ncbi:MAG: MgtC/SapB family protein [Nitrospirae bacterium]|nr:MgtC/SapB family protein [Nitrospirota bacterium]
MYDWHVLFFDSGKLVLAAVLGGAIGFERETHGQAAGFRTYFVVSTAACLMMLLSLHMEELYRHLDMNKSTVRVDPGRIASYAIASMGFLGAGAIIKGKGTVRGLTTAAGLWAATGIGLSIGSGYIYQTLIAECLILVNLYLVLPLKGLLPHRMYSILSIKFRNTEDRLLLVRDILSEFSMLSVLHTCYEHNVSARTISYRIRVNYTDDNIGPQVVKRFLEIDGIETIEWTESDVP